MTLLQARGEVIATDPEGFIVAVARRESITQPWAAAVESVVAAYQEHLGDRVHSVYLRGSVARGTAIDGLSDIDTFVAVTTDAPIDLGWVSHFRAVHRQRFPFCSGVEIVCLPVCRLHDSEYASWRMVVKTQSVCLFGDDLARTIPSVRPGPESVVEATYLRDDLARLASGFRLLKLVANLPFGSQLLQRLHIDKGTLVQEACRSVMKRVVRSGFETVMEDEHGYTRDLYPCYQAFSRHFPRLEPEMRRALELAIQPSPDPRDVIAVLDGVGAFVVAEATTRFGPRRKVIAPRAYWEAAREILQHARTPRETHGYV